MESRKSAVMKDVQRRIERLVSMRERAEGRAEFAELRRGIGHMPGDLPQLWGAFLKDMPADMMSKTGQPTREEWAIYLSVTMYALHQQGQDTVMHQEGISLGTAAAKIAKDSDDLDRVWKRLIVVSQADQIQGLAYHLRNMIQLLKAAAIPLDYVNLGGDLYDFQSVNSVGRVRLRWGQDFFKTFDARFSKQETEEETNEE